MKFTYNDQEVYIDGLLKTNLDIYTQAVDLGWDGILFVGGYEGDAKSTLAGQIAAYFDPTYNIDRCVFTPGQFINAVNIAKPKTAVVYDEAQDAFESTNRDKLTRAVKSVLTRIRRKQLYILIVAPDFWRINKYLFIHRSRAFIRVYAVGLERGRFEFYNRERKHELYIRGKREEKLCVDPNFRGRFTKWFPLNEEEYNEKKEAADVGQKHQEAEDKAEEDRLERLLFLRLQNPELNITNLAKIKILGWNEPRFYRYLKDYKAEKGES